MSHRSIRNLLLAVFAALCLLPALASAGDAGKNPRKGYDQFIVKFKDGSAEHGNAAARQRALDAGAQGRGVRASTLRRMGMGADVVRLSGRVDFRGAEAFMNRLRRNKNVEYVEIDAVFKPTFEPNDTFYLSHQWHYHEATGGIGMPAAWNLSTGTGVVVAVLDTGILPHTDLVANTVSGYDFITSTTRSNDGNGRDADPADPGDWVAADECGSGEEAEDSSWHGTHVAGTIAAVTNNAKGVAGVAFNAKVMPIRVLGKCGGAGSDIADAIWWAAGATVPGVPNIVDPPEVLNLSLGGEGSCGSSTQAAINTAVAAGITVVVSSGNENAPVANYQPANCANVVVVGATTRAGAKSSFSNYGANVDVSAPGGGDSSFVASTWNSGKTVPSTENYVGMTGTSMAAPHVAGLAALMQAVQVSSPAAIETVLKSTARALPVACAQGCGAGIVNAPLAVGAVGAGALLVNDVTVTEGNAGTKLMTFTVSLSKAMAGPVTFDVSTTNATATAGSDYLAVSLGGQVIPAGQTSKTFDVTILGDTTAEGDETFAFNVTSVTGIAVGDAQGIGTLTNDDPILLSNGVPVNGLSGSAGKVLLYAIELPSGRTSLSVSTGGGTGDADLYVRHGVAPTGAAGSDCASEGTTSTELCNISNPAAGTWYIVVYGFNAISNVTLTATFTPAAEPVLSVADASTTEGDGGSKILNFNVNLNGIAPGTVTFDIATSDGTAVANGDYIAKSTLGQTIAAGQSSGMFSVTLNGDTAVEDNETFAVTVTNVSGASVGDAQGLGRITNDDVAQLRIVDAMFGEGNAGTSTATFEILLSQPMPSPVTFDIATSSGVATAGSDFVSKSQTGRFLDAGRTRAVFEVPIIGDTAGEVNETFNVTITNVVGATLQDGAGVGTIVNDDAGGSAAPVVKPVLVSPVVLGFDGKPLVDERACLAPGTKRTAKTARLPTCIRAQGLPARAKRTPSR